MQQKCKHPPFICICTLLGGCGCVWLQGNKGCATCGTEVRWWLLCALWSEGKNMAIRKEDPWCSHPWKLLPKSIKAAAHIHESCCPHPWKETAGRVNYSPLRCFPPSFTHSLPHPLLTSHSSSTLLIPVELDVETGNLKTICEDRNSAAYGNLGNDFPP